MLAAASSASPVGARGPSESGGVLQIIMTLVKKEVICFVCRVLLIARFAVVRLVRVGRSALGRQASVRRSLINRLATSLAKRMRSMS